MRQQINTPYVILVVDSDPHYRQTLAKRLREHGHTVIQLPDGEEVLELYEYSGYPDMVILSDALPGIDGLETCTRLQNLPNGSTTPVLMLTDRFEDDDWVDQIYEAGADECLSHDVRPRLLCHRVNYLLEVRDMRMILNNENRYQILSDLATDYAYQMRVLSDGRIITEWASESAYSFTGYQSYHVGIDRWRGLIHPDDKPLAQERYDALLSGESRSDEFRLITRDGSIRWVRDHAYPIWSPAEQRVIRIYGIGLDITSDKETVIALSQIREALDAAQISVWDWDVPTDAVYLSASWGQMLGYDALPTTMNAWQQLVHPADRDTFHERLTQSDQLLELEYRMQTRNGDWLWMQVHGHVMTYDENERPQRVMGIQKDINELKRTEAALRKSEERHRIISNTISDYAYSYIVHDDGSLKKDWSTQAFHEITGYSYEEMDADGWTQLIHPDDYAIATERFERLLAGEIDVSEFRIRTKSGDIRWLRDHGHPVMDSGRVVRIYGAAQDITQHKLDEERLREQALELQSRNDELDAFAQTVAHDLKNPISTMMGFASLVENYYNRMTDDQILEYINLIMESGYKAKEIIDALLLLAGVSQTQVLQIGAVDMAPLLKDVQRRLRPMIDETDAIIDIPAEWPVAQGYGPWLEEVWANYLSNALKYGGRPPVIQLGGEPVDEQMVRFWVKDNGLGLSPDQQEKIFTPFTRLHNADIEGHGLGLSVVERIVRRLGGEVGIDSAVGEGSIFSFTLPAVRKA